MRPALDLQLKATINLGVPRNGAFQFCLPVKNHNLLCENTQTPRILVVLDLPREEDRWMSVTRRELVLRRSAFWATLDGRDAIENADSITVPIPEQNLFDVSALQYLMEESRKGRIQ